VQRVAFTRHFTVCNRPSRPEDHVSQVKNNLAKLSTPDRKLAEAQRFCPVQGKRLGSMGVPVKVMLKESPFVSAAAGAKRRREPSSTGRKEHLIT
jgi:hypothetical protein